MADKVTPERIAMMAAAARVPLPDGSAARIAKAVAPVVARMAQDDIADRRSRSSPRAYVAVARKGAKP